MALTLVEQFSQQLANAAERTDALNAALNRSEKENLRLRAENNALKAQLGEHQSAHTVREAGDKMGANASANPVSMFGGTSSSANKGPESAPEFELPECK